MEMEQELLSLLKVRGAGTRTDSDSLTLPWASTTASIVRIIICSLLLIVSQRFAEGLLHEVRRISPAKHDMMGVESNVGQKAAFAAEARLF